MTTQVIMAKVSFRAFLTLHSSRKRKWIEIKEGTRGILGDDEQSVIFEYGTNDSAEAPLFFGDGFCKELTYVYDRNIERI